MHYAKAWPQLKALAELLESPVMTTLPGKSAFPETHPLSLGSVGIGIGEHLWHMLQTCDFVFGKSAAALPRTSFGTAMPKGKKIAHATLDPYAINKDVAVDLAAVGDAGLTLDAILEEVKDRLKGKTRDRLASVTREIKSHRDEWDGQMDAPPDLGFGADLALSRGVGFDAHGRSQQDDHHPTTPAARATRSRRSGRAMCRCPISAGARTTQLGYGLGLAMGAKLACPDKLCINFWGDAAIGFTGMDFETAVRERLPIMSILSNNFSMAIELKVMPVSTEKYRSDRYQRQLRRFRQGARRPRRTHHRAGPDQGSHQARRPRNAGRQAGAPRIHHRESYRRQPLRLIQRSNRRGLAPIGAEQALDSRKLRRVRGNDGHPCAQSLRRNQQIVRAYRRPVTAQLRPQIARNRRVRWLKGDDLQITVEKNSQAFGVLLPELTARDAVIELE